MKHPVVGTPQAGPLDLDERAVLRDGDLLGRMIDTFVLAQIRPEVALTSSRSRLYHLMGVSQPAA